MYVCMHVNVCIMCLAGISVILMLGCFVCVRKDVLRLFPLSSHLASLNNYKHTCVAPLPLVPKRHVRK